MHDVSPACGKHVRPPPHPPTHPPTHAHAHTHTHTPRRLSAGPWRLAQPAPAARGVHHLRHHQSQWRHQLYDHLVGVEASSRARSVSRLLAPLPAALQMPHGPDRPCNPSHRPRRRCNGTSAGMDFRCMAGDCWTPQANVRLGWVRGRTRGGAAAAAAASAAAAAAAALLRQTGGPALSALRCLCKGIAPVSAAAAAAAAAAGPHTGLPPAGRLLRLLRRGQRHLAADGRPAATERVRSQLQRRWHRWAAGRCTATCACMHSWVNAWAMPARTHGPCVGVPATARSLLRPLKRRRLCGEGEGRLACVMCVCVRGGETWRGGSQAAWGQGSGDQRRRQEPALAGLGRWSGRDSQCTEAGLGWLPPLCRPLATPRRSPGAPPCPPRTTSAPSSWEAASRARATGTTAATSCAPSAWPSARRSCACTTARGRR